MIELINSLTGHEGRVWHISWAHDGKKFASCGEDKTIRIWILNSLNQFTCISVIEDAQSRTIRSCEWSPLGNMIASASFDGTVVIWEAQDKSLISWDRVCSLDGHDNEVKSVAWNFDGSYLATCGRDKKVWVWENLDNSDFECIAVLDGHTQDVKFVVWHPNTNVLFSTSYDDTIRIWKEEDSDWYATRTLIGHSSTVWGLALNEPGNMFISCSDDRSVILWECESQTDPEREWRKISSLRNLHQYSIYSIDWNANTKKIISGGGDNNIVLTSIIKGDDGISALSIDDIVQNAHDDDINCIRWNPSRNPDLYDIFLSSSDDGKIKVWRFSY